MIAQTLAVACVVAACSIFAAWTLMPAAARRSVALALLRLPLPQIVAARLAKHSQPAGECGCDGCDRSTARGAAKPAASAVAPITFHPRARR